MEISVAFRRVGLIAKSDYILVMSVRLSTWNKSVATGRIFMKLGALEFFENMSRK